MAQTICPNCKATGVDISIIDSELNKEGGYSRERFECNACDSRFFSYELSLTPEAAGRLESVAKAKQLNVRELIEQI